MWSRGSPGGDLVQLVPRRRAVGSGRRQHRGADIHRRCEHAINHADSASRLPADAARKDAGPSSEPR
jgi:hypothetical protein